LWTIARAITDQIGVLQRIPEQMDPALYYKTFRPYIRFFENVSYEADDSGSSADVIAQAPATVLHELPRRNRRTEQHHAHAGGVHENSAQTVDADQPSRRHADLYARPNTES
jgi:hypothetical protein